MIGIASIYPSHHAHEQLEIKKHEKARINPQIKHICSGRFRYKDYLWVNTHRLIRQGRRVDRGK